jgi:hypothetical protein
LIAYAYDAGSGPIDLVTGGQRAITNTVNPPFGGPKATKYGTALTSISGTTTLGIVTMPSNPVLESFHNFAPYTFACGFMLTTTPGSGSNPILFSVCDAATSTPIKFGPAFNTATDFAVSMGDNASIATATGLLKINQFQSIVASATTSNNSNLYIDGALALATAASTTGGSMTGARMAFHGYRNAAGQNVPGGSVYFGVVWKGRALTAAEARLLHDNPYCFLIYPEDELFDTVGGGGLVAITGTVDLLEAPDTALFNGFVGVSGTLAVTEALDTALFNGFVGVSGTLATTDITDVAAFAGTYIISGTLTTTEAPDVAVFAANVGSALTGTLTATEAQDAAVFAGSVIVSGTLAATEAKDTAAFAGGPIIAATLAATEVKDTASFAGSVGVSGTLAVTEAKDVAVFAGSVIIAGTLAVTEAIDVADFAAAVNFTSGTLVANEAGVGITNDSFPAFSAIGTTVVGDLFVTGIDTAVFNGFAGVFGTLIVTEARDTASFTGTLPAVLTGTLAANEAGISLTNYSFLANSAINTVIGTLAVVGVDVAAFNGAVGVNGTLGVTETKDAALFNGQVIPAGITGTLTVTEAKDTAAFNGVVAGASGTLAVTEAKDTAIFAATTVITGTLAAIETVPDTAAFNGKVGVSATLGATESTDVALFNGYIGIAGLLAATEAKDLATFTGSVIVSGTLAATETRDAAAFVGHLVPMPELFGILVTTEATDTANFNAVTELFGILSAIEASDIAYFDARTIEEEAPADFENWKFGRRFDRSLTSRFPWQG